jgi:DNA-binding transcriptional LysR family regulator
MDAATLIVTHMVAEECSVRAVARKLGRPVSTISMALHRLEMSLSVELFLRTGVQLTPTLELARVIGPLSRLREICEDLIASAAAPGIQTIGLETLRRFSEVVRSGSIHRAATRLGVGQPQLSRQIASLESDLGFKLFERANAGCTPTEAGWRVHAWAQEIEALWVDLDISSRLHFSRELRTVRIGSIVPAGHESRIGRLLAAVLAKWTAQKKHHYLALRSMMAEDLLAGIRTGEIDVAVVDVDPTAQGVEGICLTSIRLVLAGNPGFARSRSAAEILRKEKVAVPGLNSGLRRIITRIVGDAFVQTERTPPNFIEVDTLPVIVSLITGHDFVSVLPFGAVRDIRPTLDTIELDAKYDMPLWIVWQSSEAGRCIGGEIHEMMRSVLDEKFA